jgi:hypothetical protein
MVGKTAQEVAKIASDLYHGMMNGGQQGNQPPTPGYQYQPSYVQQPQQFQAPPPQQQQAQLPTQEDWMNDPQSAFQRSMEIMRDTQFAPQLNESWTATASTALSLAQMKHKEAFDKWGPEIMQLYNQLDPRAKATASNIDMIVKMVRGGHVDDMQKEMEERLRKEMEQKFAAGGSLRPDTATGQIPSSDQFSIETMKDDLPPEYRRQLERHNITDADLSEFLLTKGRDLFPGANIAERKKAWLDLAKKGDIITERKLHDG